MNFDFSFAFLGGATPSSGRKLFSNEDPSLSNEKKINKLSQKYKPLSLSQVQTNNSSALSVMPLKENGFAHGACRKRRSKKYETENESYSVNPEGKVNNTNVCTALPQSQSPKTTDNRYPQFVDLSKVSLRRHQRGNFKSTNTGTVEDKGSKNTADKSGTTAKGECTAIADSALRVKIQLSDDEINNSINASLPTENQNGDMSEGRRQLPVCIGSSSRSMRVNSSLPRRNMDSPLSENCAHLATLELESGANMDSSADSSIIVRKSSRRKCISETTDSSLNECSAVSRLSSTPRAGPLISEQVGRMGNILRDISLGNNCNIGDGKETARVVRSLDSDIVESSITEVSAQSIKSKKKSGECLKSREESDSEKKYQVINQNLKNSNDCQKTIVIDWTLGSDDDVEKSQKKILDCKTVGPDLSLWKSGAENPTGRLKSTMAAFDSVQRWLIKSHSEEDIILLSSDTESPYATPLLTNELQKKTMRQHSITQPGLNTDEEFSTPTTFKAKDSKTSTQHCAPSVAHAAEVENVLDSLYGSEWRGQDVRPLSESRPATKEGRMKQLMTLSERPKQSKISCSSSSEDEFDELCRNLEQRKALFSLPRRSRLDSVGKSDDELIGDYESGNSAEFFQGLVNSLHKSLPKKCERGQSCDGTVKTTPRRRKNVRRLSFRNSDSEGSVHKRDENIREPTGTVTARWRSVTKSSRSTQDTSIAKKETISNAKKLNDKGRTRSVGPARDNDGKMVARKLVMPVGKADDVGRNVFKLPKALAPSDENEKPRSMMTTNTPAKNGNGPVLSFLSSLSVETGSMRCHPEAVIYKQKFKAKKEELCRRLFDLYNMEVFENKLDSGTPLEWNARMRRTGGFCYMRRVFETGGKGYKRTARIVLSSKVLDSPDRLRDTLIHEMCHAAAWVVTGQKDGHGPIWKGWTNKAMVRFPELPTIRRCHAYAITTKFTYKCTSCGYGYNRHSKSVDVVRKRCGFCHGKLMLIVNKDGVGAQPGTGPSEGGGGEPKPPRAPSAFALYVKHNYGAAKTHNKHLKHGELMRLLGQQFTAMKIAPVIKVVDP